MANTPLERIVFHTNKLLKLDTVQDYERACNGLQVENDGRVTRIAATVDATLATVRKAVAAKADLLIVHHGLFWGPAHPWTGPRYQLLRLLLDNNLSVYSAHLPLDLHPDLGNNVLLCRALGFTNLKPFFFEKNQFVGLKARTRIPRDQLTTRLAKAVGLAPKLIPGGPSICRSIGVVTGGAGDEVLKAAAEGVDTFITGEGRHWTYGLAEEAGLNVFHAGHYATETFGVKALAEHLSNRFKLPWTFIDHPTGL